MVPCRCAGSSGIGCRPSTRARGPLLVPPEDEMIQSCIECDTSLTLEDVEQGDVVSCPECGLEMEVVSVDPPALDLVREELEVISEEDWTEA